MTNYFQINNNIIQFDDTVYGVNDYSSGVSHYLDIFRKSDNVVFCTIYNNSGVWWKQPPPGANITQFLGGIKIQLP